MGTWMPAVGLMLGLSPDASVNQPRVVPWSTAQLAVAPAPEHPRLHGAFVVQATQNHDRTTVFAECLSCDNLRVVPDRVLGGRAELRVPVAFDFTPGLGQLHQGEVYLQLGMGVDRVFSRKGLPAPGGDIHAWWTPSLHAGLSGGGRFGWTVGLDHDRVPTAVSEGYTAALSTGEPGWTRLTGGFVWRPAAKSRPERVDLGDDPDLD